MESDQDVLLGLGDRVEVTLPSPGTSVSSLGTILFKGELAGMQGLFFGVALDSAVGKNDGTIKGVRYFDAQPNHGLFVKQGAKNVAMKRVQTAADDSLLHQISMSNPEEVSAGGDDLIGGWGEANPFEKSSVGDEKGLPNIADWGSPISNSFQQEEQHDASPIQPNSSCQIDDWDPAGPIATPVKGAGGEPAERRESLVPVPLCESRDISMMNQNFSMQGESLFANISVADDPFGVAGEQMDAESDFLNEKKVAEASKVEAELPHENGAKIDSVPPSEHSNGVTAAEHSSPLAPSLAAKTDSTPFSDHSNGVVETRSSPPSEHANDVAVHHASDLLGGSAVASFDPFFGASDAPADDPFVTGAQVGAPSTTSGLFGESTPQKQDSGVDSLFGESSASGSDRFVASQSAPVVDQVLNEAAVLFGSVPPMDDPFASVSPGAVESVLQEAANLFKDELPEASNLFGGVEEKDELPEASNLFGCVEEKQSPFTQASSIAPSPAAVKAPQKHSLFPSADETSTISEIPDLFGAVQDNVFAAPAPKPVTAPGITGYGAPKAAAPVKQQQQQQQQQQHQKQSPLPPSPAKPVATVAFPVPVPVPLPVPVKVATASVQPVPQPVASPVLPKVPTSPAIFKAPVPVPLPVPAPVKVVPTTTAPVKSALPAPSYVAPSVTVPVASKVVVPTFQSFQQPVRSVPTAPAIVTPPSFAPPVVKQPAPMPPLPVVQTQVAAKQVATSMPPPASSSFVPPSTFVPPPAITRVVPPVFQQPLPRFTGQSVPTAVAVPTRTLAQVPPPSPQSSAVMAMTDDFSSDPFEDQSDFIPQQQGPPVAHVNQGLPARPIQHQPQQPLHVQPPVHRVPSNQQFGEAFFPSMYGQQSAPSTPQRAPVATTYVSSPTGHFSTLQSSTSPLDDARPAVPIWSWGFGGRCAVMFPRHRRALSSLGVPPQSGEPLVPGEVKLIRVGKTIGAKSADLVLAASFPGPLRAKASKSQVTAWLRSRVSVMTQLYQADPRPEVGDELVLWEVLTVICEHDGDVRSAGAGGGLSAGQAALIAALKAGRQADLASSDSGVPPDFSRLPVVEGLLSEGKLNDALGEAVRAKLWSHALFLASFSPDPEMFQNVRAQFASEACAPGSALRSLYLMLSGQMSMLFAQGADAAITSLDKWRESAAMLLANGSPASYASALGTLGDGLWSRQGRVFAAHVCYVLAQAPFLPVTDSNARLVLVGGDHKRRPNSFVSAESVQRSEVLEYCKSLGNSQYSCPELERYKLSYAVYLAELGEIDKAFAYVTAIEEAVRNNPSAFRSDQSFLYGLKEFEERLVGFRPTLRGAGSKSLVRSLFGGVFRAVVGSDSPPPVVPVANVGTSQQQQRPLATHTTPAAVPVSTSVTKPAQAPAAHPKEEPAKEEDEQQDDSGGGGGWGFWPFGSKKKAKEVKLGNQLARYYNEELKMWVRPGEEDKVRATISAPPPSDMLLRGAPVQQQPQQFQAQAAPPQQMYASAPSSHAAPPPSFQQTYTAAPSPQMSHVGATAPPGAMPAPSAFAVPQVASAPAAAPAAVPNFSRAAAGGSRQRRYVDTLNTGAPARPPATSLSMPALPNAFAAAAGPTPQFKMFVPAPVVMAPPPVAEVPAVAEAPVAEAPPVQHAELEHYPNQHALQPSLPSALPHVPPSVEEQPPAPVPAPEEDFL